MEEIKQIIQNYLKRINKTEEDVIKEYNKEEQKRIEETKKKVATSEFWLKRIEDYKKQLYDIKNDPIELIIHYNIFLGLIKEYETSFGFKYESLR